MPKWHHKNKKGRKCLLKLTKNKRTNKIILSVQKLFVLLQTEINRGTVLLDVQNLVMTFRASQPVDFFFLCLYRCDTVLYLLARTFDSHHHLYLTNTHQFATHLLHLGEDFLVFDPTLGRFGLAEFDGIAQDGVELQHSQRGSVGFGSVTHGFGDGEVADVDVVFLFKSSLPIGRAPQTSGCRRACRDFPPSSGDTPAR